MSILKTLVATPLAGALLFTALAANGSAIAAPNYSKNQVFAPGIVLEIDHRNGRKGYRGGWQGERRGHWGRMGPREIRRSLRHRGFHRIRIVDARGPVYIVKARGWRDQGVRLVVDARNGRILKRRPLGQRRHWNQPW